MRDGDGKNKARICWIPGRVRAKFSGE